MCQEVSEVGGYSPKMPRPLFLCRWGFIAPSAVISKEPNFIWAAGFLCAILLTLSSGEAAIAVSK